VKVRARALHPVGALASALNMRSSFSRGTSVSLKCRTLLRTRIQFETDSADGSSRFSVERESFGSFPSNTMDAVGQIAKQCWQRMHELSLAITGNPFESVSSALNAQSFTHCEHFMHVSVFMRKSSFDSIFITVPVPYLKSRKLYLFYVR
jgi:hypothetical protein